MGERTEKLQVSYCTCGGYRKVQGFFHNAHQTQFSCNQGLVVWNCCVLGTCLGEEDIQSVWQKNCAITLSILGIRFCGNLETFSIMVFIASITISIRQTNTTKPVQRKDLGARLVSLWEVKKENNRFYSTLTLEPRYLLTPSVSSFITCFSFNLVLLKRIKIGAL